MRSFMFCFHSRFSPSVVYFTPTEHLTSHWLCFNCSVVTCGWRLVYWIYWVHRVYWVVLFLASPWSQQIMSYLWKPFLPWSLYFQCPKQDFHNLWKYSLCPAMVGVLAKSTWTGIHWGRGGQDDKPWEEPCCSWGGAWSWQIIQRGFLSLWDQTFWFATQMLPLLHLAQLCGLNRNPH